MDYRLLRIDSQQDHSMGVMFTVRRIETPGGVTQEQVRHICYTLEDEFRRVKVTRETRIPAGTYELKIRTIGSLTKRYESRFPDIHEGMIWLQNVPNFKWIYIHCGNDDEDTRGCILVGSYLRLNRVLNSRSTYKSIYPGIVSNIKKRKTYLEIIDYDTPPTERII